MNDLPEIDKKIPVAILIGLHLGPGIIFACFFICFARLFIHAGLAAYSALLFAIPFCLAPLELGIMLLWSARHGGAISLAEVLGYRSKDKMIDYIISSLILLMVGGIISIAVDPASQYVEIHVPNFLPLWVSQNAMMAGFISRSHVQRVILFWSAVLFSGFLAPIVEEMYFRGFLLPRMAQWGRLAPVVNSLLFALYHFYFPGNVLRIFLVFLPISYLVWIRNNWRIGVAVHCMINLWGLFSLAAMG